MEKKRKSFLASSPGEARQAVSTWLGDFRAHGPLKIRSIRVREGENSERFVATVTFSEMPAEPPPPQHFADYEPVLLKSA